VLREAHQIPFDICSANRYVWKSMRQQNPSCRDCENSVKKNESGRDGLAEGASAPYKDGSGDDPILLLDDGVTVMKML
jgi:hypothetical protein